MKANFLSPDSPDAGAVLGEEGVVFFDALFDAEQVARTREALARYEREVLDAVPSAYVDRYDDGTLRSLLDLHHYDTWFHSVAHDPRLMDLVRRAAPWDPVLYYVETFPKPPGAGALPAHQEIFTVPVEPPDFVHLWIALEDVTSANGGMAFYRRSHRLGIAPHVQQSRYFGVEQALLDRMASLRIEPDFPAGSAALFDCHTIHVSGANESDRPRPVLVIGFRGAHTLVKSDEEVLANCVLRICREELGVSYELDDDLLAKGNAEGVNRVLERIWKDYGVRVSPAALGRIRTPAALAAHIDAVSAGDDHGKGGGAAVTQGNVPEDLATIAHRLADEGYVLITGLLGEAELALARASHAADGRAAKELARTKLRTLSSCLHTMSGGHDPGAAEGRLRLAVVLSVAVARSGSPHPDGLHAPVAERGGKEPAAIRFGTVATPGSALLFDTRRVYVEGVGAVDGPVCLTVGPQRYGEGVAGPDADRASALAERIVGVFHEVLGEEGAGSGASFFELGGTSLEALRVVSLLREREHVRLELSDFFAQGSPAELAAIALSRCCEDEAGPGSSLRSRARRRARRYFPLSLSQEGLYAMDHGVKGAGFFNSVWWMRFQGAVDLVAVEGAVNDAVLRQPTLRTVIESHGGRPAQRVLPQPVPIGRADLRDRGGRGLRRIMAGEAARGFDLERQAPARFQLVRLADDTTALVGTVHHVAFDGVSCDLLIDEIAHAYAVRLGASDSRPELRRHYADFAEWQRDTLRGDRLAEHLDGLRAALSRPSPRIAPAPERKYGFLGHVEEFEVPEATAQRLAAAAARQGTSLFVLLVAAMTRLGTRLSGEPRQTVSVQAANRSWPGSEHIVGCFSNVLPVVGNGHEEVVPTAHAGVVEALRHEEMPFDAALSLLGDEGFDLRAGLPPLGFALQTSPGRRIELPGCAVTTGQFTETGDTVDPTPFPLVLELWEDEGLRGVVRSLRDAWPDDSYQRALGQLHGALADASLCGGR